MNALAKISDFAEVFAGGGAPQNANDFSEDGIPFLRAGSLPKLLYGAKESDLEKITNEVAKKHRLQLHQKGSVVFAKSGMSATKGHIYRLKNDCYIVNHLAVIKPNAICDSKYLEHALKQYSPTSLILDAAYPSIRLSDISDFKIPLPPLAEQQRIAAILDKAEDIKRKREQAIAKLDELAQNTFVDMFGDPSINQYGFEICKIRDLLTSASYGTSEKSSLSGTVPVLRMNNITATGELDLTNLKYMDLSEKDFDKYLAKYGDILFNRTNSPELVGKSALFDTTQPFAFAGYLIRLRANKDTEPAFIAGYLNTKYAKKTLRNMCKSIIGMANINAKEIQSMSIPRPPLALQTQYKNKVFTIKKMKEVHQRALKIHVDLTLALQHQAFTTGFTA